MQTRKFELWFPFTSQAIGMTDAELPHLHNQPLARVMAAINQENRWRCVHAYLTQQTQFYVDNSGTIDCEFYPESSRRQRANHGNLAGLSLSVIRHLLINPPDAVGFFMAYGRFVKIMAMVCDLRRIPYIVIVGGWYEQINRSQLRYYSHARAVLMHTQMQKEALVKLGYDGSNMEVFPLGVDVQQFHPKEMEAYTPGPDWPRLLYVGRLTWAKGAVEAVHAFAAVRERYPQATLSIAGSEGNQEYVALLHKTIDSYGLHESVRLLGPVAHVALPDIYRQADVFLFPSIYEGLPQVVLESMACGTPVVAVHGTGGTPEVIEHGVNGLIVEMPRLAHDLLSLLEQPEQLAQMGQRAAEIIYKNYSFERTYSQLVNILTACERP